MSDKISMRKVNQFIKRFVDSKNFSVFFPRDVEQDIKTLKRDLGEYYARKILLSGTMIFAGILLMIGYVVWLKYYAGKPVGEIKRPKYSEETIQVVLKADNIADEILLELAPQQLSKEEADVLVQEVTEQMEAIILAENTTLNNVTADLYLPEKIDQYPFEIYWESDNEEVIDYTGKVNRYDLKENKIVNLTAVLYYEDWMWKSQMAVCVEKEMLTEEEQYKRQIVEAIKNEEVLQREEAAFILPSEVVNNSVVYRVEKDNHSLLILSILLLVSAVMLWIGQDNDLRRERDKKREIFELEYVPFVSSFSMYISAGVTLQGAMNLCIKDYSIRKTEDNLFCRALSEFQRDIQNGYGFIAAMDRFSAQTDNANYRRLAGLLNQSTLNGSRGLASALEEEVTKIQEEKRRKCKVKGEQISTALIGPMMLQLGIVIALIMIPAFSNMQF